MLGKEQGFPDPGPSPSLGASYVWPRKPHGADGHVIQMPVHYSELVMRRMVYWEQSSTTLDLVGCSRFMSVLRGCAPASSRLLPAPGSAAFPDCWAFVIVCSVLRIERKLIRSQGMLMGKHDIGRAFYHVRPIVTQASYVCFQQQA